MAIKIQGSTIIDDGRNIINADNVGIGTTNPTSKLTVYGDGLFTGILTANRIVSEVYGEFTGGTVSADNIVGTALSISGISTFSNGPVFIGSGASTGTEDQKLQVTGGAYVSGNLGIGTTNPQTKLEVGGVLGFGAGNNVRIGDNTTGANLTYGFDNIFMGIGAGNSVTYGSYNNFFGKYAGHNNIVGSYNNFFGPYAGYSTQDGCYNNFFGRFAGFCNTYGNHNNFFGYCAGYYNITGSNNTFIGKWAGYYHTTGNYNNAFGVQAGNCNLTGSNNNFFGRYTGIHTNTSYRVVIGQGQSANVAFDVPKNADKQFAVGINSTGTTEYWLVGNENFNIGIGTTNPTSKLTVDGDAYFSGILTANRIVSEVYGEFTGGTVTGTNIVGTALSISGISTFTNGPVFIGSGTSTGTADQKLQVTGGAYVSGNLGIGVTNPQTKLQVGGVIGFNDTNIRIGDNTTGANLTSGYDNIFMGVGAGSSITTGNYNNFFGKDAGKYSTSGNLNNFVGRNAGKDNTGSYNTFFGANAGRYNTSGSYNSFFGQYSGRNNNTGSNNIFFGSYSGISTSASNKVIFGSGWYSNYEFDAPDTTKDTQFAVGVRTDADPANYWIVGNENFNIGIGTTNPQTKLEIDGILGFSTSEYFGITVTNIRIGDNTTGANLTYGHSNIFMGVGAGNSTTNGGDNNFFGRNAGYNNTSGGINNFFGLQAGYNNTTGNRNTFIGEESGFSNTTGTSNNFIGRNAGYYNTIGNYNTFFGTNAGGYSSEGSHNTFIGDFAGGYNTTGSSNIFFGSYSGISTSTSRKVILGTGDNFGFNFFDAPDTTKDTQLAIGVRTDANESKYWLVGNENFNIGIGTTNPTTKLQVGGVLGFGPGNNVRIGDNTTGANLTSSGYDNIFMGIGAGNSTTGGRYNNFFGNNAGYYNLTGNGNNFFGPYAGYYNIGGSNNNFIGNTAGFRNTYGGSNNFFGIDSGCSNTIGSFNNFIGLGAGNSNTIGNSNNFFGGYAGKYNQTGNYNIFFGSYSGISTSASRKVIFGSGFGSNYFDSPDTTKDTQFAVGIRTDANPSKYWLVGNENFNVGIGTTNPQTKLEINGVLGFTTTNYYGFSVNNIRIGDNTTGANLTGGINNIFMGVGAGNSVTDGSYNNFFGNFAGHDNTLGCYNNFFGLWAGCSNQDGCDNNFFGRFAGYKNIYGTYNNFFGRCAGYYNIDGCHNNFFGNSVGFKNTDGYDNNFFGRCAGYYNTTGSNNTFIGKWAGYYHTTGEYNSAFGVQAGNCNLTGSNNNFFGRYTGIHTNTSYRVVIGQGQSTNVAFDVPKEADKQFAVGINSTGTTEYWLVGNENFNVGIGTTNPTSKLYVGGDIIATFASFVGTHTYNAIVDIPSLSSENPTNHGVLGVGKTVGFEDTNIIASFVDDVDSYAQVIVQNRHPGTNSSADFIVNNNQEEGVQYYGDFGINGSNFIEDPLDAFSEPNGVYLYSAGGSLTIGSQDTVPIKFAVNFTEVARVVETGIGIGTTNPTEKLHVIGNILVNDTTLQGSITATTLTTSAVGIHSALPISTYRSVEYTIQATEGSNFHATKILALHDGSSAYLTEYGTIYNNSLVSGFDIDVSGGNIRLLATPTSASLTKYTVNFVATRI